MDKSSFKTGEATRVDHMTMARGDKFGVIASSHGDALALAEMIARLRELGATAVFHTGDITGEKTEARRCVELTFGAGGYGVQGNHDVLAVGHEFVHTYDELVSRTAESSAADLSPEARDLLAGAPVKIETPFFTVVHESVAPPYYAKRSKRRRRDYGWNEGSSGDENMTSIAFGKIDRPHFIGSDHAAYVISGVPLLKVTRPRPGEEIEAPRRCVISVPSICFSRDDDYDCGGIFGVVGENDLLKLKFFSLKPRERSPVFSYVPDRMALR